MERINLWEYDRKNMKEIEQAISKKGAQLHLLQSTSIVSRLMNKENSITFSENH